MALRLSIILGIVILLQSCNKEEADLRLGSMSAPVATGFVVKDEEGNTLYAIGIPNSKTQEVVSNQTFYMATLYGNTNFYIYVKKPMGKYEILVWVTPAVFQPPGLVEKVSPSLINQFNANAIEAGGYPIFQYRQETIEDDIVFSFDSQNLPEGFYRVYVKMDEILLWENIYYRKIKFY